MELNVQVEKPTPILRKLTIRVPAQEVANRYLHGLNEVQKTAKLKGFRPGHAPISVIKQYYGEDVRHRLFHNLIDESYQQAIRKENLKAIGSPKIETPEHKTGGGEHDHAIAENQDLTFTATVEVMPDLVVKGYTGISLKKEKVEITDKDVDDVVNHLLQSHSELIPATSGLADASGKMLSRAARKGDHADIAFDGGIVTESGVERREGMKGSRVVEIGSDSLIHGFEDHLIGMTSGEKKTFRIQFPDDYFEKSMAGKEAEFTVDVNEVKEKKIPELNDDFAKDAGYEGVADLRQKAKGHLLKERTEEVDRKLRSELITQIIEKNAFEVPLALVESQTRALAQEWAQDLKKQGLDDKMIQSAVMSEIENLRKRSEQQVRASLLLEGIASQEKIELKPEEYEAEIKGLAVSMNVEEAKVRSFYLDNAARREDFLFRVRQERTLKFVLDQAKIK
ncbi:trigger factor [Bdellovibrionota bacterium FG-1]